MREALRVWRRHRVQHAMIGNAILFLLLAAAVVATGGVDWWPVR